MVLHRRGDWGAGSWGEWGRPLRPAFGGLPPCEGAGRDTGEASVSLGFRWSGIAGDGLLRRGSVVAIGCLGLHSLRMVLMVFLRVSRRRAFVAC